MPTEVLKSFVGQDAGRKEGRTCQHCILWTILLGQTKRRLCASPFGDSLSHIWLPEGEIIYNYSYVWYPHVSRHIDLGRPDHVVHPWSVGEWGHVPGLHRMMTQNCANPGLEIIHMTNCQHKLFQTTSATHWRGTVVLINLEDKEYSDPASAAELPWINRRLKQIKTFIEKSNGSTDQSVPGSNIWLLIDYYIDGRLWSRFQIDLNITL